MRTSYSRDAAFSGAVGKPEVSRGKALLVNAEGEVVCAKSMSGNPLAVKLLEERDSRLRFKPVKSKGEPVSADGLLFLKTMGGAQWRA